MNLETLADVLLWALVINAGLFVLYFVLMLTAGDWVYRTHSRWFAMSRETFDAIHYCFMAAYKTAILFFILVPYLAIKIVQ
jgi:hypothetical protein